VLHTRGGAERSGCGFKHGFRDVVLIPAVPIFNVEVESALLHERFHKLFDQLGLKLSDAHRPSSV